MLSLFTRRVALSTYRSGATCSRILPPHVSSLRGRRVPHGSHHTGTARTFTNPQRNASTKATAATNEADSSTESSTTGRAKPKKQLTPEQLRTNKELDKKGNAERAAALRAKKKAQAEKKKEAAALRRKRLAEKEKILIQARRAKEREREKAKEAKKPKIIKPPPRRMNAYSLFVQDAQKSARDAAVDWRNLSEEAKQEYAVRAKGVSEKRREEFDAFLKTITRSDVIHYNRFRRSKGASAIRTRGTSGGRPLTAFMNYMREFRTRPEQAGKGAVEVSKAAGEAWSFFTQEEKDKYKHKPTESATV